MVIKATEPTKMERAIRFVTAQTVEDLKSFGVDTLYIKVYSNRCGPCRDLSEFLHSLKVTKDVVVVEVNSDENTELINAIVRKYKITGIPFFAHVTKDFDDIENVTGFEPTKIKQMLQ